MRVLKNDWHDIVGGEFGKGYYLGLREFLIDEYRYKTVYPDKYDIFNAFHFTRYEDVKVIILGQDPYHGPNQAHGLCFSVNPGVPAPPSLVNIFKELKSDLGCYIPNSGYLKKWADQGVMLLNSVLTVRAGAANSHRNKGWELFTDRVISALDEREVPVVFMLWGRNAHSKLRLISGKRHLILRAPHPSPLSAYSGFFGCGHFSKANRFLESYGMVKVDWQIDNL